MDKRAIEYEARRLQFEIWNSRELRYPLGVPGIPTLFDPRNVADHCGLYYEERERLDTDFHGGGEAAGLWRKDRSTILISRNFPYEVRRFTAGHEIGHFILHPHVGERTLHREFGFNAPRENRPALEREADFLFRQHSRAIGRLGPPSDRLPYPSDSMATASIMNWSIGIPSPIRESLVWCYPIVWSGDRP